MPPVCGRLRAHAAHALAHVVRRARIGEEQVLDARPDGAHREIGARLLLDLHHRRHVRERVHRPRQVLQGEEVVGRVLAHELDVVEARRRGRPAPPPRATRSGCGCRAWAGPPAAAPAVDCVACAESRGAGAPRQSPRYTRPVRDAAGPLSDLVILDLTRVLAGPYCTRLLADLGARVIKIERPRDGDDMRKNHLQLEPGRDDQSTYFMRINAGKESVAVDLSHPRAATWSLDLAGSADVFVENFAPGVVEQARPGLRRGAPRSSPTSSTARSRASARPARGASGRPSPTSSTRPPA